MMPWTRSTRPSRAAFAAAEGLDVGIGVDIGQGVGSLFEVVVEPGEALVEVVAELRSNETGR